jgi:3-demethoxyubiquinol 3-hydroxylase
MPAADSLLEAADSALRTLFAPHRSTRLAPHASTTMTGEAKLSPAEQRLSGALMRVNHVGEVCAQALYTAQAIATTNPALKAHFLQASAEETDHLAWTKARLDALGSHPSLLNPLWYAGAFTIGFIAGKLGGDSVSLGFVAETERQVEAHLQNHMDQLPAEDHTSRAIVQQMKDDEIRHAQEAVDAGAQALPAPVASLMRAAAKVMTTVAHRI